MLRVRLASIPVEVHLSHVLFIPVLALLFAPRTGWAEKAPTVLVVLVGGAIVSGTLLLHELGHALAARAFGYRPVVQLVGMTARTLPNPNETMPWYRDVILHFAGPATGLTVGFTAAAFYLLAKHRIAAPLEYALMLSMASNLIWAGVSLLPIHPLDGGRIVTALSQRVFGRDGFLYAQVFGLCTGVALAAIAFANRQPLGLFALIYVAQTAVLIIAFRRGDLPKDATHPLEQAHAHARALYDDDQVEEALRVAEPLLDAELQPALRARVHLLLGWVRVKLGQGMQAVHHFDRAAPEPVPPQGLAAAYSLIGDDARALPLWERAARQTRDPTLLHEWAGALIRSGREAEARQLPDLHLPAAFEAAQRVYEQREDFENAARMAEARFAIAPSARRAYEAARLWARANRTDDALRLLAAAAQHGFSDLSRLLHDDELSAVRAHVGFKALISGLKQS